MSRVNHKLIKQRLNENRSKITDRQFFSSRILAGHFEDLAAAQTRRYLYNRRVHVYLYWKPNAKELACTDNHNIHINCGNEMVTKVKGRESRYEIVSGLFAHELGHVLYTDFLSSQTHTNYFSSYQWFPCPPPLKSKDDISSEKALWDYIKKDSDNLQMIQFVALQIANIIEDGYVENRMLINFPGTLGYGLEKLRELHFESIPTVTQLIEQEENNSRHIFESILQLILSYVKYGEIKYGDEPLSDVRIQKVFSLITDIDKSLMTRSGKERLEAVNIIMVRCWPYLEEYLEHIKERHNELKALGKTATDISEALSEQLNIIGNTETGKGNSLSVNESEIENNGGSATAKQRSKTISDAAESGEGTTNEFEEVIGSGKQKVSESERGRIPYHQSESVTNPSGGTVENNELYKRESYENAAKDIQRILDKMAEKAACKQLENERLRELNESAQNISYGNIHSGVSIRINRITSVDEDMIEQYNDISAPLIGISRRLQKSLVKELKESRCGGKRTGLLMGRRIDTHALCRSDGKVFYKNDLPSEIPELAVGLLIDESGSMCSCDRCTYARASAIILYDFCRSLEIPIMVYGHSTRSRRKKTVELYSYAEFDSIDTDDKYRMIDIGARNSNRDGAALRYVAEKLSARPEAIKILILISDGQPADYGYTGSAAEEDLRGIKQEYQRKGILFAAAAIGEDKNNIQRIYDDSYLDITDLNQLPIKLTGLVKRHIKI